MNDMVASVGVGAIFWFILLTCSVREARIPAKVLALFIFLAVSAVASASTPAAAAPLAICAIVLAGGSDAERGEATRPISAHDEGRDLNGFVLVLLQVSLLQEGKGGVELEQVG